jgi:hypothetical protein
MGLVNALRKQVDRPSWEWLRFAPAVSSSISSSTITQNANFHVQHGRYIYYFLSGTQFWRYDTWTDSYLQLTSPPAAPTSYNSIRFLSSYGYEGRVLAATTGSITIPAYFGQVLKGFDVTIVSGTGAGQRRVISSVADAIVADSGVPTAASTTSITDSTKTWAVNQFAGFQVRTVLGTGISQVRKILYNSATTLTFADVNKYPEDTFCNPAAPSPALSITAGSQSIYQIESSVVSVDQNWLSTPDSTSRFRVASGAILFCSINPGTYTSTLFYYYDVAADLWYIKTYQSLLTPAFSGGTDNCIEVSDEAATTWDRGFASSGTTTTLIDSTKSWGTNQYVGYWVFVAYGTAAGQMRKVTANTATALTFATGTAVDATSSYMILGYDGGTATAGGTSTLTDSSQNWATNRWRNHAVRILSGTGIGQVLPVASNTSTALTMVKPWAVQPDSTSVYVIVPNQDTVTAVVATMRSIMHYGIDDDMWYFGRWNESGACRVGAYAFGSFKPCAITSITKSGTTATVTTVNPISFPSGSTVTISGATGADAATYNVSAAATITGVNTFAYTMGGTPSANAVLGTISTTTLIDSTKSWATNQWAGYLCHMTNTVGPYPVGQTILITSNTANTLTFVAAVTIPANGVTKYVLTPNSCPGALATGTATGAGQSQTILQDTSQNWVVNQWAGRVVKFLSSSSEGSEAAIASNTSNALTINTVGTAAGNGTTTYAILAQSAIGAGIEIRHAFGTSDAANKGKFLVINRGGGVFGFNRLNVATDQFEMMATSPNSETLNTGSMFAYDGVDRIYFTKEATQRVYYLDVVTGQIHGAGIYPYVAGTAVLGNRMEIFTTADGLKFLWLNRHSNLECFRSLLFW